MNVFVGGFLFERGQTPGSDKAVPHAFIPNLAAGQSRCGHSDKQNHHTERKQFFHLTNRLTRF